MCLGVPGQIREIRDERGTRMATVDFGGVTKTICLAYVPDADIGDYTIVHAGFAITRLDEESAQETLRMMREAGMLDEELGTLDDSVMTRVDTTPPSAPAMRPEGRP
jgi:hydrogenase expression/formation protein HypC